MFISDDHAICEGCRYIYVYNSGCFWHPIAKVVTRMDKRGLLLLPLRASKILINHLKKLRKNPQERAIQRHRAVLKRQQGEMKERSEKILAEMEDNLQELQKKKAKLEKTTDSKRNLKKFLRF
eukprot:m.207308 g.207308  ORF g.207308 m.207308 type:complete len:123 (+) comp16916_c0_seq19:719-1087(+)